MRIDEEEIGGYALAPEKIERIEQTASDVFDGPFIAAEAVRNTLFPGSREERIHGDIECMGDDFSPMLQEFSPGKSTEVPHEEFLGS